MSTVADPGGGQFGATDPRNACGATLKWRRSDKNALLFGSYRCRNKGKNTQSKSKLNNALHFSIYGTDFDPVSYRLESTLLLFRNNAPVPLFLLRVRIAQQSQTRLSVGLCKFGLFFLQVHILGGSFERKSSREDKNAKNGKLITDARF